MLSEVGGDTRRRVRDYYIRATESAWDYAPLGKNGCTGEAFNADEDVFVTGDGATRIGSVYRKARYVQCADTGCTQDMARAGADLSWPSKRRHRP